MTDTFDQSDEDDFDTKNSDEDYFNTDNFNAPDFIPTPMIENEEDEINNVTSAILDAHSIEDNEEFSTEFDDEVDDEGVKIFKGNK